MMEQILQCRRCKDAAENPYTWTRRKIGRLPKQCPNCKRQDWNKEHVSERPRAKLRETVTVTKDTVVEAKIEEASGVAVDDGDKHPIDCDCTLCLLNRGLL